MSEDQLILGCINDNGAAQKLLYNTYLPYLLTIGRRYGILANDESDAMQEIYIEIFSNLKKYNSNKGSLKTWIRTIAVHKILNLKRKQGKLQVVDRIDDVDEGNTTLINYQNHDPNYILKAIQELPEGYRTVFNLYEVDGYTYPEIAKMLNVSEAGVRSQFSRARSVLRNKITNIQKVDYGRARKTK